MTDSSRFDPWTSHQVVTVHDEASGLKAAIALDDLTLGPGFGGVRMRPYASATAAVEEAQRLAHAMTYKHALAELPYGGAKSVVSVDPRSLDDDARTRLFEAFGDAVASLDGRYIPGVDMGTTLADMALIRERGAKVYCAEADPAPWTARGAYAAMRAGVRRALGAESVAGLSIAVQGVGAVGGHLARMAAADGATLLVADTDSARVRALADEIGAIVVEPDSIVACECDVFAPAAVARVITADVVPQLRCRLISGAANDTLDSPEVESALLKSGITFVPDFVANAGGVIHEHARAEGWSEQQLVDAVEAIEGRVAGLVDEAGDHGGSLVAAATARADARLARGQV